MLNMLPHASSACSSTAPSPFRSTESLDDHVAHPVAEGAAGSEDGHVGSTQDARDRRSLPLTLSALVGVKDQAADLAIVFDGIP